MKLRSNDRLENWTAIGQFCVLIVGFALIFSWEADFQPKALATLGLALLVLIYAMPDRLRNRIQEDTLELQKSHAISQILLLEILEIIPSKASRHEPPADDQNARIKKIAHKLATLRSDANRYVEEGFYEERDSKCADRAESAASAIGLTLYLTSLIGLAALSGWIVSLGLSQLS